MMRMRSKVCSLFLFSLELWTKGDIHMVWSVLVWTVDCPVLAV